MRPSRWLYMIVALFAFTPIVAAEPLLVCGWDEVFLLDVTAAEKGTIKKLWSWRGKDREELSPIVRKSFGTTDDCRPIDGGRKIMVSSSGGAVAVVDRESGKAIWHARVPNAHGIESLPGDRIVAASSTSPKGNRLMVFDLTKSDHAIWETPLISAHGVVWDAKRERLWALGLKELRSYSLKDWSTETPSLKLEATYDLPDNDGHDLSQVPNSNDLVLSTHAHVYLFDRESKAFRLHPELGDFVRVKGVAIHPKTGRLAFTKAEEKQWWTPTLRLLYPAAEIAMPGERMYRIRWLTSP